MEIKGFVQFEIVINVLVSSFWFIWIPVSWVYGQCKYLHSYSAGIEFMDVKILKLWVAVARHNLVGEKWVKI